MFLTSTDLQTRRARCQHQLSFLSIAPYGRNLRGAGGKVGSVFSKSLTEQK